MVDTLLNPTMRNENVSYKIKIKNEEGNILGMREFNHGFKKKRLLA